jgi:hypothetical protein
MRRRHRRVRSDWKGCKCPSGTKKVSTCTVRSDGKRICPGRGWGCLGVGPSQKGKPSPRFLAAICGGAEPPPRLGPGRKPPPRLPPGKAIKRLGPGKAGPISLPQMTTIQVAE